MGSIRLEFLLLAVLLSESTPLVTAKPANIPSFIHVCKRNDPNVEECIKNSIEDLRPQLSKGIPEMEVPALEPLVLPEVIVKASSRGANFNGVGKNIKVYGASNFKIDTLKLDLVKNEVRVAVTMPKLTCESDYEVDARILVLPVKGKGPLRANATNVKGDAVLKGKIVERDGDKYLTFETMDLKIFIENYKIRLDGLFGGDKVLGEATNAALNEGNADFIRAVTPVMEKTTADVLLKIANQILKKFPYKELFPEA